MALSTTQYGYIIDPMVPFTDGKGNTIKDGFVRVFVAGSSTPVVTYRNFDGAANQDIIELDNSGRTKTSVIGSKGLTYKVCVYDKHHSQESPILTVDKVSVIGANITAGTGATVVTGLDGLTTKPDGFVDASVIGTDGYVALDHTLVTDDLNTDAKVTAVENDRYIPLLNDDVNDPDSKITLGRLWQWVLGKIKSLSTTITAFRSGDVIPVDGPDGTAKMSKDDLLREAAENTLVGNVADAFDAAANYTAGQEVIYNGKLYRFKLPKSAGSWDSTKVESANLPNIYLTRSKAHKMMQSPMVRVTAESRLAGVFFTSAGAYQSASSYEVAIFKVTAGDVLFVDIPLQNEGVGALGFYSSLPSSTSDLPVSVIPCSRFDIGNYDIVVESDGFVGINITHTGNYGVDYCLYKRDQTLVELTAIKSALRKVEEVSSVIADYFVTYQGKFQYNPTFKIRVYEVEADAVYYIENPYSNNSVATFGFTKNAPSISDGSVSVWTQKDAQYFIPSENGYLLVSCPTTSTCSLCRATHDKTDFISYSNGQIANLAGEINGYYFSSSRTWQSSSIWKCIYTRVNKGDKLGIDFPAPSGICNFAFFTSEPSNGSTPSDYSVDGRLYVAPASGYVLTSYRSDFYDWHLRLISSTDSVADILVGRFGQSRLLCIGDSISTRDNYKWKGYLETYKGIKYVRDITGEPAPANGGIKVTPASNDDSLPLENRSIWWRCCNKRLAAYENNFDYILFCGGTNDWANEIPVGTINDPPYVDDASTVESADAVDVMPDTLTYASALKGCIEMLRRDFPTKGIFIRTLYQMSYSSIDPAQIKNYSTIIVKVALKYGLKLIWSQDMWSDSEVDLFTLDGVHPNNVGAYRLANEIAKAMFV